MDVTLITGASGGIGEAFARRLAAEKHNLLLVARSEPKLRHLCDELTHAHGVTAQYVALDLVEADAAHRLAAEVERRGLAVTWLINNAGLGSGGDFAQLDLATELRIVALNVTALLALTHRFLQPMRTRNQGVVINVASIAAFFPTPFQATYAATKAFVRSFTEAITAENAPFDIQFLLLCPGLTATSFFGSASISAAQEQVMTGTSQRQTPAQVVEATLRGLRKRQPVVISGTQNKLLVGSTYLLPNSLIARLTANRFRAAFQLARPAR